MNRALSSVRLLLAERYDEFVRQLGRRLGSVDLAEDALQDTYVRLSRLENEEQIRNPRAYIFRMAFNAAISRLRSETRRVTVAEGAALLDLLCEGEDFEQEAETRSELRMVEQVLREMPARRQAMFRASWVDEEPTRTIAERHDVSVRTVQMELKIAAEDIARRLGYERAGYRQETRGSDAAADREDGGN